MIPMTTDSDTDSSLTELVARHSETQIGLLQIVPGAITEPSIAVVRSSARKCKGKVPAQVDTSTLRRNNRSTKYDGFHTSSLSEVRPCKS